MITRADVDQAAARIKGLTRLTPILEADQGTFPGPVWFKCEFMQHTGTFKARRALNRILASKERDELHPEVGVVVASGGNAGLATPMLPPSWVFRQRCSFRIRRPQSRSGSSKASAPRWSRAVPNTRWPTRPPSPMPRRPAPSTATLMTNRRSLQVPAPSVQNSWTSWAAWIPCWWRWVAAA